MRRLIAELRRRHVDRAAAGYVVTAWLAVEVSDTVTPHLPVLPEWLPTLVIVLLLLGAPFVVVTAWVLGGRARREDAGGAERPR